MSIKKQKSVIMNYGKYINAIRRFPDIDKSGLKNKTSVSYPTIDKNIRELFDENALISENGEMNLNRNFSFHVGISVESDRIKLVICDFLFNIVHRDFFASINSEYAFGLLLSESEESNDSIDVAGFSYKYGSTEDSISQRINKILNIIVEMDKPCFNIVSIGIAFPGIINKRSFQIDFSPNIKGIRHKCIINLINNNIIQRLDEQDICLSFEHDSQAISLFEYEKEYSFSSNEYPDNFSFACVMIDKGIGLSIINNNYVFRGRNNSFGELGHIPKPQIQLYSISDELLTIEEKDDKKQLSEFQKSNTNICECGKTNCLEDSFRRDILSADTIVKFQNKEVDELNLFHLFHPYRYRLLKEYIGYIISFLVNVFNADVIVFSSEIVGRISQLSNEINSIKDDYALGIPSNNCKVFVGKPSKYATAMGAAISSYYFCQNNCINFFTDI